jgi:iron complex transport system ATP-binding protein
MSALVEARGLSLPGRLFDVSVDLGVGELVCLVGPNGSGKTSLLHALAGIGRPSGEVRISGADPRPAGPGARIQLLTFLPASRDVPWPLLARDLIALGGGTLVPPGLELEPLLDRRVDQLSMGERSRVLLARALAPRPKLLLLDEPTSNLDPLWQIRLMEMLKDELKETARAALVAIHDLDAAARYADRILVMNAGRIAAEGLDGPHIPAIFGVERVGGEWRPAVRSAAGRRSSP